ncbi:MAG TPA: hypothetical protein VKB28_20240, partial [Solirubrobacteraceae bacterium]|nr:hypothetical protein [Solirubrobacteraceae bacterium]
MDEEQAPGGARDPTLCRSCIPEKRQRQADCSYPCNSDTARVTCPSTAALLLSRMQGKRRRVQAAVAVRAADVAQ